MNQELHKLIEFAADATSRIFTSQGGKWLGMYHGLQQNGSECLIPVKGEPQDEIRAAFHKLSIVRYLLIDRVTIFSDDKPMEAIVFIAEDDSGFLSGYRKIQSETTLGPLEYHLANSDLKSRLVGLMPTESQTRH